MRILLVIILFVAAGFTNSDSIYDYSFTTIEGIQTNLANYQGKKIIILILPINSNAENGAYLHRLDSLSSLNAGKVVMIGVPSVEDGYTNEISDSLRTWYRTILGGQFMISKGLNTRKSTQQDGLFKWLTNKDLNQRFDLDVEGVGQQFFISEAGRLYAVVSGEGKMSNKIFNKLVQ